MKSLSKIWFISGISSGLGKALAEALMSKDIFVIGTMRGLSQTAAFNSTYQGKGVALVMDLRSEEQIARVVEEVKEKFGHIDVLVNNAGYGLAGAIEEVTRNEIREVFEANFFGSLYLTQLVLPLMRQRASGHIIQISSHGGFKAFAGLGIYHATKFALEGASEALAAEVAPLGIKVTIVEPGPFRTNFAGSSLKNAAKRIDAYENTAGVIRARMQQVDGHQEGDPAKAAEAIINISGLPNPPLRLPLGKIALTSIRSKLESVSKEVDTWEQVARKATF